MKQKGIKKPLTVEQQIKRRNFLSFGVFGLLGATAYGGWRWLYNAPAETPGVTAGARLPLRRALNKTELFFRRLVFNETHLVKTYPVEMATKNVRHNEDIGAEGEIDAGAWRLEVIKKDGSRLNVSLPEIQALPKTDLVFDFKCVEGWDQIQHWGGVRFIDFINHFGLQEEIKMDYVGLMTPDKGYYVGLDTSSAIHPQTLLAYEMNGKPLPTQHGKPLRLIIPVKYGIKNLKRIGTITFSNQRPPDYWAEHGYDYYSGL
ncbi:DMSO/TMAO reductase YedYZ molybdopterin-dependent catalytic subunit [Mucilaginibacter yixingensis]|uniref:DMSO/TMAO reductase YedYZ molybdopterin-dependent catalytic subunit n=1 Tax=Mucilaginibacter yixingensis TaxID=1295612 RepID=A0A2T5J4N3_9SPHI|nr:molybdopterin-dependent oxidoreductase [Mucilaginibacter yixingensis]PTQ92632.1 DMSO/TMAO reductase YedYZ molybdopterin-dependent catalytic subunit [Mucilaginibacter yixingensis]